MRICWQYDQVDELAEAVVNQSVGLDALIRALPLDGEESSSSEGNTERTMEDEKKSEMDQARALQEKSCALEEELRIYLAVRIMRYPWMGFLECEQAEAGGGENFIETYLLFPCLACLKPQNLKQVLGKVRATHGSIADDVIKELSSLENPSSSLR